MSFIFILALVCVLLTFGQTERWPSLYGLACLLIISSLGMTGLTLLSVATLFCINLVAWLGLRGFTTMQEGQRQENRVGQRSSRSIWPVLVTLLLEFVIAFAGAGLGLGPILAIGLVLGSLCLVVYGEVLVQFYGILMALEGLLVLACMLSSWPLYIVVCAFFGLVAVLGMTLLPRLAWRKTDDDWENGGNIFFPPVRESPISSRPSPDRQDEAHNGGEIENV